jgi:tRNA threonylcarbamoyladenosine biosynthesis protein TsaB
VALILHIDTATELASVCLSNHTKVLSFAQNNEQKNHAGFLQPAIQRIMLEAKKELAQLDAIAVSNGPGSYTGLRVGLASAKGICYVLNKPLLLLNTLQIMAAAIPTNLVKTNSLLIPMIDARRMEVFTAIFNANLAEHTPTAAAIITETSYLALANQHPLIFTGSGCQKLKQIFAHVNIQFHQEPYTTKHMVALANKSYQNKDFANLAYSEPFYGKAFYSTQHQPAKNNM